MTPTPVLEQFGLDAAQTAVVTDVRNIVNDIVLPNVQRWDANDEYPTEAVDALSAAGLFGLVIGKEWGGQGVDLTTYALAIEEACRGWMSLGGIINTHVIVAKMLQQFGTPEQQERYLPRMATGELRAAFSMTEPQGGSDLQAITTTARREGAEWSINGEKMWIANGLRAGLMAVLLKTDPEAQPRSRGVSCMLIEKTPMEYSFGGLEIPPLIKKLGYNGIDSARMTIKDHKVPAESILGGTDALGHGFRQMLWGVEIGRLNVAMRGVGTARRALELALTYAGEREAFGQKLREIQAIRFKLADMATKIEYARLLTVHAARIKQLGGRADVETGMAKLTATEICQEVVLEALRIHAAVGYIAGAEIGRLYRDAPMILIGEGTSEIQKMLIGNGLLGRWDREEELKTTG